MDYRIHENGWTVIVENFDLHKATDDEILLIGRLIMNHLVIVFRGLNLSPEQEADIINRFPRVQRIFEPGTKEYKHWVVKGSDDILLEVTGKRNEEGEVGFAGDEEMPWHCNDAASPDRRKIVWLYGQSGTAGSRTSWNNTIVAYADLDDATKEKLNGLRVIVGNGMDEFQETKDSYDGWLEINEDWFPSLVCTNQAGKVGMFWPMCQAYGFKDMDPKEAEPIIEMLEKHILDEKYLYHHEWQDGDLIISDQLMSVHKRWHFDGIANRFVHRGLLDYPEQDYTKGV